MSKKCIGFFESMLSRWAAALRRLAAMPVYWGRAPRRPVRGVLVLFPVELSRICCGLAGIVTIRRPDVQPVDVEGLEAAVAAVVGSGPAGDGTPEAGFLGGEAAVERLFDNLRALKQSGRFYTIFTRPDVFRRLEAVARRLGAAAAAEGRTLETLAGRLGTAVVDRLTGRLERFKDAAWCLDREVLANVGRVAGLLATADALPTPEALQIYQNLNTALNSLDRLEVRGRDSAGVSLLFSLTGDMYAAFHQSLTQDGFDAAFRGRQDGETLRHGGISVCLKPEAAAVSLVYKVAAEIGSLGDNIRALRRAIRDDAILHRLVAVPGIQVTISAHTRWASVGAITEANCHPVDNGIVGRPAGVRAIIHACLNGDIDNYRQLRRDYEARCGVIPADITSDTKIIPLQVAYYLEQGLAVEAAFRRAVNDFEGSHAIAMHTDLAPGRLFLAQRGSGQTIFVGIADEMYLSSSEVYGLVEVTDRYLKMDGEQVHPGLNGPVQGQIFVLEGRHGGGLAGIRATAYDGTPLNPGEADIKRTAITSRDVDRQDFAHYFLKEINEAPLSVARTLHNRWKLCPDRPGCCQVVLDERTFSPAVSRALAAPRLRRVFFVGQGTAGVAARACAGILKYYLNDAAVAVEAMKASELSGFHLGATDDIAPMADALVVAISQSGTTTDTNRAVDMARARGALTAGIVNRRDSDLTFKVDAVVYTSSGRDIEMSVASTKAFYAQIVAGALLSLHMASVRGRRDAVFVTREIRALLALPEKMRAILAMDGDIARSARRLAPGKAYWAVVGSGPNKASADEIRIKLSELCYKTISSDYVEDKKHIDLSSEPLILLCAAGTRGAVVGDIVKDTAIFAAHKATPVVFCDEEEHRFAPYAADVFHVPTVPEHLAPIVNTLAGHLWGYHAALAINDGSRLLHGFREELQGLIDDFGKRGLDVYEIVLEKSFREKVAEFYREFRGRSRQAGEPTAVAHAADLFLLLKYLSGRLPMGDFEIDFGVKGTARNMLEVFFQRLAEAVGAMARPVDAIKHQAKTVTVGTSRIEDKLQGLLFDALARRDLDAARLTNRNILVLRNVQGIVERIQGAILYRVENLNLLGEPTDDTRIEVVQKEGVLAPIASRVETDPRLQGTKRIIVREGNVYIGKGRKDDRSIIVIPVLSAAATGSNTIANLLLLNVVFKTDVSIEARIRALGGKFERLKNLVQEHSVAWRDDYLDRVPVDELFGRSAEKLAETILEALGAEA
jgi:glutamine---fructose-6-phosphate transaminase (isomerizing)